MQGYVVLPQALRSVVPAIVNAAIALFKATTYVMVVGLFDLLNIVVAGLSDANWIGLAAEGYVFVGVLSWTICFGMSRMSASFEHGAQWARPAGAAAGAGRSEASLVGNEWVRPVRFGGLPDFSK